MLGKSIDSLYLIKALSLKLSKENKHQEILAQKLCHLEEDIHVTLESFVAKDAIKDKRLIKATKKYAENYYCAREYALCQELIQALALQSDCEGIGKQPDVITLTTHLIEGLPFSFSNGDMFRNPYPSYLFFSQAKHAGHFSSKSQRPGVAAEPLNAMVDKLKSQQISPQYLRVNIYLAQFRGEIHPFVYNNRTWVVFSRAGIMANRIVPVLPTQDLLNRITKLDAQSYPNVILNEDAENPAAAAAAGGVESTVSLMPGPKLG
jgi:hypothetical protein